MTDLTAWQYRYILRHDFGSFVLRCYQEIYGHDVLLWNWHLEVLIAALQDCIIGQTKRLIVNVPPRHLKSFLASVALPAFWLGHNPAFQIMCVSYAQDLSDKLARDFRQIVQSAFYQALFPAMRLADKKSTQEVSTTKGGYRLATSVGGVVTGRGADVIIIDDPLKPIEALSEVARRGVNSFYDNSLYSRLNSKVDGCIILVMQRLHEDDLAAHVMEREDWEVVRLRAIAEQDEVYQVSSAFGPLRVQRAEGEPLHAEREPLEVLRRLRQTMTEYNFASQYQQNPMPVGGAMIKHAWLKFYDPYDAPEPYDCTVLSLDTAIKATELSDYSVATFWGIKKGHFYLIDVMRQRLEYPDLKRALAASMQKHNPGTILIEDKASGSQLIQELRAEGVHNVTPYATPPHEKIMRVHSQTASFENGFIHLPNGAPFLAEYVKELTGFPGGRHDDQVDSTIQAIDWHKNRASNGEGWIEYMERQTKGLIY